MAVVVDSSIWIALERRGRAPADLELAAPGEPAAVASITISELLVGAHRADTKARRDEREAFVDAILTTLTVLPFDREEARVHSRISVELAASGRMIGSHDLLIAATALAHGYAVLTENLREFQRVPGLVVRQPAW